MILELAKRQWTRPFIRFLVVGVLNTAFGYSLFVGFFFVGLPKSVALLLATVIGVIFNFSTIRSVVFQNKDNRLFLRFVLVYMISYLINLSLLESISLIIRPIFAQAMSVPPVVACTFFLMRAFVFTHKTIG